jgi:actin-related protein
MFKKKRVLLLVFFCFAIFSLTLYSEAKPQDLSYKQFIFPESHLKKIFVNDFWNLDYRKAYFEISRTKQNEIFDRKKYRLDLDRVQVWFEIFRIARNEIFARKGYKFESKKLRDYFCSKKWYKPVPDDSSIKLNETEEYNISLIKFCEYRLKRKLIYPKNTHPKTFKKEKVALIDLDGDGIKDSITFNTEYRNYQLTINDITINGRGDSIIDSFAVVDIDNRDNIKEIVISDLGPSDDDQSTFFYYTGTEIKQIGKTYSLFYRGITFDGWGGLIIRTRGDFLQTWFFDIPYRLSSDHLLEKIPDQIYKTGCSLFLKQPLKVYNDRDEKSNFVILEPTTTIMITGTDNEKWCSVKTLDGIKGWFFVEKYYFINGTGVEAYNIFDGLSYAD